MSSTVAYPRTQTTTSNRRLKSDKRKERRKSTNGPFQTDISSQRLYVKGFGRVPLRKGILLQIRDTPGFQEDIEYEISVQCRGEKAVVLVSTKRTKFPVQIESSPLGESGKFAVFAHGVLIELAELHNGKQAFRLISQHADSAKGINGKRCSFAKFLHNCRSSKNGTIKLTLSRKGN